MAVAHDASTKNGPFSAAGTWTFTHTPVGTPKGVLLLVTQRLQGTDQISAASYGGVAMSRVTAGFDTVGEPGGAYVYFLGSGIPTGAQTVSVTTTGAADKIGVAVTLTAAADTTAAASAIAQGDQASPQVALDSLTASALRYVAIHSGLSNVTDLTAVGATTAVDSTDHGVDVSRWDRTASPATGSVTVGYTSVSDDVAMAAVAVAEVAGGVSVTAPPAVLTLRAPAPTVILSAGVTAPPALLTLRAPAPSVALSASVSAPPAVVTLRAPVPSVSVSGSGSASVTAPPAVVTLRAPAPTISVTQAQPVFQPGLITAPVDITAPPAVVRLVAPAPTLRVTDRPTLRLPKRRPKPLPPPPPVIVRAPAAVVGLSVPAPALKVESFEQVVDRVRGEGRVEGLGQSDEELLTVMAALL